MNEDYLWDKSGPPDPEVERLEAALAPFRYRAPGLRFERCLWRWPRVLAAASIVVICGGLAVWFLHSSQDSPISTDSSVVIHFDAVVEAGRAVIRRENLEQTLESRTTTTTFVDAGTEIRGEVGSRVRLQRKDFGTITLEDAAVVRIESLSEDQHRLHLEKGKLSAIILPPPYVKPRLFQVGTPRGLAVDLGCAYTMEVASDGTTVLTVTSGCVAFETKNGDLWVPRHYSVRLTPDGALTAPLSTTASSEFRVAVASWLESLYSKSINPADASSITRLCRPSDGMTLIHLIPIADLENRRRLIVALSDITRPPEGVSGDALEAAAPEALARWRRVLCGF